MILMSINAFMKLPEEEKFETLRHVCKGDIQLIDFEQIAIEMGVKYDRSAKSNT